MLIIPGGSIYQVADALARMVISLRFCLSAPRTVCEHVRVEPQSFGLLQGLLSRSGSWAPSVPPCAPCGRWCHSSPGRFLAPPLSLPLDLLLQRGRSMLAFAQNHLNAWQQWQITIAAAAKRSMQMQPLP